MKIAIVGGHFSPAFALMQKLKTSDEIIFLGRKYTFEKDRAFSFEYKTCIDEKIRFFEINTPRIHRNFDLFNFFSLPKFLQGLKSAYLVLSKEEVEVVVSFGGYLSVPVACAAYFLKVPVIIHEQTQHAGVANKWIAKIAKRVCVSFESSLVEFPKHKTVIIGNLLRREVFEINEKLDIDNTFPTLYITGGSGGSHFINKTIKEILPKLLESFSIIHQTGDAKEFDDFAVINAMREEMSDKMKARYFLTKYIKAQQIGWILNQAKIVFSRAGINTVSEVLALKIPALFIPLPHGQKNEQLENAKLVKKMGLGDYILQKEATSDRVLEKLLYMLTHIKEYELKDASLKFEFKLGDSVQLLINEIQLVNAKYPKNQKKDLCSPKGI